jgi:2-oxoglutarate dehydrogenase E1 component
MSSGQRATPPAVNAWNAEYLEAEYERFRRDPGSVPEDLRAFFRGFDLGLSREAAPRAEAPAPGGVSPFQSAADDLIASYRSLGHLSARLDPFGRESQRPEELTLAAHGLDESDLDRLVDLRTLNLHVMSLREAVSRLESTYCGSIGAEIAHVQDGRERQWLFERFERDQGRVALSTGQRAHIRALPAQPVSQREAVFARGRRVADPAAGPVRGRGERSGRR